MNFYVEVIERIANDLQETIGRLQDTYLNDKTQPLNDRWETYLKIEAYLPTQSYGNESVKTLGFDNPYDNFGMERYETRSFSHILEQIEEDIVWAKNEDHDLEEFPTTEQIDAWKEEVIASGYGSFKWDC